MIKILKPGVVMLLFCALIVQGLRLQQAVRRHQTHTATRRADRAGREQDRGAQGCG